MINTKNSIVDNFFKSNEKMEITKPELLSILEKFHLEITNNKHYSIHFDFYDDLIKDIEIFKIAFDIHKKGKIDLLDNENIPYEMNLEYNQPVVNMDDIRDKQHILKYAHPELLKTVEEIGIVKNN